MASAKITKIRVPVTTYKEEKQIELTLSIPEVRFLNQIFYRNIAADIDTHSIGKTLRTAVRSLGWSEDDIVFKNLDGIVKLTSG